MISRKAEEFEQALQRAATGGQVGRQMLPLVQAAGVAAALADPPPPAPYGLAPGRLRFLAAAAQYRVASQKRQGSLTPVWLPKLGIALAAAILLFGLVFGAGQVVADGLPGKPLYGLKLAVQDARLLLTTDPQARADLSLALAEERLDEITTLLGQGQPVHGSAVDRIEWQLRAALRAAAEAGEAETVPALRRLEVVIEQRERTMMGLMGGLAEPGQTGVRQIVQMMEQVRQEAQVGQQDPDGLRQRLRQGMPAVPIEQPGAGQTPGPRTSPHWQGVPPTSGPGTGAGPRPSATHEPGNANPGAQPGGGPGPESTRVQPGAGTDATCEPHPTPQREASPSPVLPGTAEAAKRQPTARPSHTSDPTGQPEGAGPGATSTPRWSQPTEQPGVGPGSGPGANPTSEPGNSPGPQTTDDPAGPGTGSPPPSGSGSGSGAGAGGQP